MKKSILALALLLCLTLTGCADLLERSYEVSSPHMDRPATAEDPSILRVENYRELVSAVLYLVSQGEETGVIQLYDYAGDVEADLAAACLEVAAEDPLGAYFVDYIKHELIRVVSYDQATLSISYRRTPEQVASMVRVTGTSAIRAELRDALNNFDGEVVLRVAYLAEDQDSLSQLVRQAYYDAPVTALGMPQVEINLYPDSGRERVVEFLFTYPGDPYELSSNAAALSHLADEIAGEYGDSSMEEIPLLAAQALYARVDYEEAGPSNAYGALMTGRADSEGMALSYSLLCGRALTPLGGSCGITEGTLTLPAEETPGEGGEESPEPVPLPRFWNVIFLPGREPLYLDPAGGEAVFRTAQELFELGYRWEGAPAEPTPEAEDVAEEEENPVETQ